MSKKEYKLEDGSLTADIKGYLANMKRASDPYGASKDKCEDKPWYMQGSKELKESVLKELAEYKETLLEIAGDKIVLPDPRRKKLKSFDVRSFLTRSKDALEKRYGVDAEFDKNYLEIAKKLSKFGRGDMTTQEAMEFFEHPFFKEFDRNLVQYVKSKSKTTPALKFGDIEDPELRQKIEDYMAQRSSGKGKESGEEMKGLKGEPVEYTKTKGEGQKIVEFDPSEMKKLIQFTAGKPSARAGRQAERKESPESKFAKEIAKWRLSNPGSKTWQVPVDKIPDEYKELAKKYAKGKKEMGKVRLSPEFSAWETLPPELRKEIEKAAQEKPEKDEDRKISHKASYRTPESPERVKGAEAGKMKARAGKAVSGKRASRTPVEAPEYFPYRGKSVDELSQIFQQNPKIIKSVLKRSYIKIADEFLFGKDGNFDKLVEKMNEKYPNVDLEKAVQKYSQILKNYNMDFEKAVENKAFSSVLDKEEKKAILDLANKVPPDPHSKEEDSEDIESYAEPFVGKGKRRKTRFSEFEKGLEDAISRAAKEEGYDVQEAYEDSGFVTKSGLEVASKLVDEVEDGDVEAVENFLADLRNKSEKKYRQIRGMTIRQMRKSGLKDDAKDEIAADKEREVAEKEEKERQKQPKKGEKESEEETARRGESGVDFFGGEEELPDLVKKRLGVKKRESGDKELGKQRRTTTKYLDEPEDPDQAKFQKSYQQAQIAKKYRDLEKKRGEKGAPSFNFKHLGKPKKEKTQEESIKMPNKIKLSEIVLGVKGKGPEKKQIDNCPEEQDWSHVDLVYDTDGHGKGKEKKKLSLKYLVNRNDKRIDDTKAKELTDEE